ncbi:MAG TPA: GTPase HflX [Armatimonadota bacterium]|nr:GTPase HflX [Armatimonadota bacterium]
MTLADGPRPRQRALLLAIETRREDWEESLEELDRLAETAGVEVVGTVTQKRDRPDPVYFVGKGKAQEIRQIKGDLGADVLLVDGDLRPSQQRNLEDAASMGVLDRTALILDIFARRARSGEGKVQVELAQLTYLLPRLTGKGTELSRLGGGIGTRGPGETKLESDRRRLRRRIRVLKAEVEEIGKRRAIERRHRQEAGMPTVALVGYTNAGKSTLLNALSGAGVFVENLLFATLDPTIRRVMLRDGRGFLVSDTVGFIRNLPHQVVSAFKATLEEAIDADVLVHVIDASHPQIAEQIDAVRRVLAELGCADKPTIMAFNKCDIVPDRERLEERISREGHAVAISAQTAEGLDALLTLVGERLEQELVPVELTLPWTAQNLLSEVHRRGRVLSEDFEENGVALTARVPEDVARRLRRAAGIEEAPAEEW